MADVQKEIALKVTTDTSQTTSGFKSVKQELKETKKALVELALAGKQGSDEFKRLEQRAGVIEDTIGDMNTRVKNLANDTPKLELLTQAATGIAGGFAVAQGAAALFGDENEEVQKAIMKTQGAMTLLNGVQSIANVINKDAALGDLLAAKAKAVFTAAVGASTGALKLFRLALIATGVGAAVVAVGMLVANWQKLTKAVTDFISGSPMLTKVIGYISDGFTQLGRAIGIIPSESEAATKQMIADLEKQQKLLEAAGANTTFIEKRLAELRIQLAKETGEGLAEAQEELTLLTASQEAKRVEIAKEAAKKRAEIEKAAIEKSKAERLKAAEDQKAVDQIAIDAEDAKVTAAREAAQELAAIQNEIRRSKLTEYQREREDFLLQRAQMLELMRASGVAEIELQLFAQNTARLERNAAYEKEVADAKAKDDKKLSDQKAAIFASIEVAKMGLQGIADLAAFFAGESEAQQKKAFEIQKRVNIATTIIDGILSAQKAYSSLIGTPIVGPVLAPIAAAAAIAAALARVTAIKSTSFKSTSAPANTGGGGTIPSPSGGQQQPPAAFNPNVTNPNPIGQPQPQGGQNGTTRVIVVESDIRRVTTRVDAAERFATFGN